MIRCSFFVFFVLLLLYTSTQNQSKGICILDHDNSGNPGHICKLSLFIFRFSRDCYLDQDSQVTCRCPLGYQGRRCEQCSPGYLGRVCEKMSCEESKNIVYICRYPPQILSLQYREIANRNAPLRIYRLLMTGKFDFYLL